MTRPLSWKWEHQSASWWFATFKVGDLSYKVDFDIHSNTEAVVRFSSEAGIGVTGAGNAFAVFATVSKILFAFLEEARPIRFFFSAEFDENSRIKLYNTISKRLSRMLPEYSFEMLERDWFIEYRFNRLNN